MSHIERIERAIKELTLPELRKFREWFHEFDAVAWDRQIEEDAKSGKLDRVADKALAEHKAGKSSEF